MAYWDEEMQGLLPLPQRDPYGGLFGGMIPQDRNIALMALGAGLMGGKGRTGGEAFASGAQQGLGNFLNVSALSGRQRALVEETEGRKQDRALRGEQIEMARAAALERARQMAIEAMNREQFVGSLPPEQRAAATVNPNAFAVPPPKPTLHNIPVPGQPGITQPTWLTPGQTQGAPVGGMNMPDILNPAVQQARRDIARAGATKVDTRVINNPALANFKDEQALRKEYQDESRSFIKLTEGYNKVKGALASDPAKSAPATLAAATQFMKMLDPDSVVRESELQLALQSTGLLDRAMNLHNQVLAGQVLTPRQVEEIGKIADVVYKGAEASQDKRFASFRKMASDYGFDADRAVPDMRMKRDELTAAEREELDRLRKKYGR